MHVFLINLARRPDRLARVTAQLSDLGLRHTRVEAIDAAAVDPGWLEAQFAAPGAFGPLSAAEQACLLSHFRAYAQFLATPAQAGSHAIILEDDVLLSTAARELASAERLPKMIRLVKLERVHGSVMVGPTEVPAPLSAASLARLYSDHSGAAGYIISRAAARTLLALKPRPSVPVDHLLFHPLLSPMFDRLQPHQALPALVRQADIGGADSDIEPGRSGFTHRWLRPHGVALIRREWMRIRGQGRRLAARLLFGARWTAVEFEPAAMSAPPVAASDLAVMRGV
jgi:glycosyl transferase family 25